LAKSAQCKRYANELSRGNSFRDKKERDAMVSMNRDLMRQV